MQERANIGIIGGGLMGREVASALARWFVLDSYPVKAELTAVCDTLEKPREWFSQIPTVQAPDGRLPRTPRLARDRHRVRRRAAPPARDDLSRCPARGEGPTGRKALRDRPAGRPPHRRRRAGVRPLRPVQFGIPVSAGRSAGLPDRQGRRARQAARSPARVFTTAAISTRPSQPTGSGR